MIVETVMCAVQFGRVVSTFYRSRLPTSSGYTEPATRHTLKTSQSCINLNQRLHWHLTLVKVRVNII